MGVNSERAALNRTGNGSLGDLPDAGIGTGFQTRDHGVDFAVDATNRLGSIDASSDHHSDRCFGIDQVISGSNAAGNEDFTGSFARIDASSHAPGEENANDADVGEKEPHNYA